jgi:Ca2+-binding RTX toxin-like protein
VGGSGAATVNANGSDLLVGAGSGDLLFVGGVNAATVFGSPGSAETIQGAGGGVWYTNLGNDATVIGGSGVATLFGGPNGNITYNSDLGGAQFSALSGNETLNAAGSSTNNLMVGGADGGGQNLLVGGTGNDTILAGAGSDTMTGGAGNNEFVFFQNLTAGAGSTDFITDFSPTDGALLSGYGADQAAIALANAVSSGGNTTLTLSDNTKITFVGVASTEPLINHISSA